VTRLPDWTECDHRRKLYQLPIRSVIDPNITMTAPGVDSPCAHNEYRALRNRVLFDTGRSVDPEGVSELRAFLASKADQMRKRITSRSNDGDVDTSEIHPWASNKVITYYGPTTNKGKVYAQAYTELGSRSVLQSDATLSMFVKAEKLATDEFGELPKTGDPRAIQFRKPIYNAVLAKYTLALERIFYKCTPGMTKGMNSSQKGQVYLGFIQEFSHPAFFELDCSRFDAHVGPDLLKAEHWFYKCIFKDRRLSALLKMQLKNKAFSRSGLKYRLEGGRMSGDMNTALGNNVLQMGMIHTWMRYCGVVKFRVLIDGDDCVLIVEQDSAQLVDGTVYERLFGMKAKLFRRSHECAVEYCKGSFIYDTASTMKFCRDPLRALTYDTYTTKVIPDKVLRDHLYTLGRCMVASYDGVPVLWKLANSVAAMYPKGEMRDVYLIEGLDRSQLEVNWLQPWAKPPSTEARVSLEYRGLTVAEQGVLEGLI